MPDRSSQAPFAIGFVHTALAIALTVGFGGAAVLAALLGFELPLGDWWLALVQVHGYAQTFGWLGLFIMGVSLYFIPRFSGAPLRFPALAHGIYALQAAAVAGRFLGQFCLSLWPGSLAGRWALGLAGGAGMGGVGLYLFLLGSSLRPTPRQAIAAVKPYFLAALCGWAFAGLVAGLAAIQAAWQGAPLLEPGWNRLATDLFLGLVLLPTAFAFSIRTFPLYLRLALPRWPVRRFALLYLAAFALEELPVLVLAGGARSPLHALGQLLKGGAILVLVWNMDLLLRRRAPWTFRIETAAPTARRFHPPPRVGMPDYGEFGRFERLICAAYLWLAAAGLLEGWNGAALLLGRAPPWPPDALRHLYLAGFGTLLLLGMAPRMIPGFLHRRGVKFPGLVDLSFYLGSAAVLFRVVPVALPQGLLEEFSWLSIAAAHAFGISGVLGWLAVAALAVNLWATIRQRP